VRPEQRLQNVAELREALFASALPEGFTPPAPANGDDDRTVIMPAGTDAATLITQAAAQHTQMTAMAGTPTGYDKTLHVPRPDATAPASGAGNGNGNGAGTGTGSGRETSPGRSKAGMALAALGAIGLIGGGAAWFMGRPASDPTLVASQAASAVASPTTSAATSAAATALASATPAAIAVPTTPSLPPQRDAFTITAALEDIVRNADPLMAVNTITDKSQLVIGKDRLLFQVKSSTPGYIYVYLAGTDKSHFYLLFPNALDRDNRIEADKLVQLPRKGWHITAGGPPGVNHIVTIVSPDRPFARPRRPASSATAPPSCTSRKWRADARLRRGRMTCRQQRDHHACIEVAQQVGLHIQQIPAPLGIGVNGKARHQKFR